MCFLPILCQEGHLQLEPRLIYLNASMQQSYDGHVQDKSVQAATPQRVALKFFYRREDFEAEASLFHSRVMQAARIMPSAVSLRRFGTVRPSECS